MKYIVSPEKMRKLVGSVVNEVYPNFNKENTLSMKWDNVDHSYIEYYDPEIKGNRGIFAKYWPWEESLQLNRELFDVLETYLGENMNYVIDWFNNEFDMSAESVTF